MPNDYENYAQAISQIQQQQLSQYTYAQGLGQSVFGGSLLGNQPRRVPNPEPVPQTEIVTEPSLLLLLEESL